MVKIIWAGIVGHEEAWPALIVVVAPHRAEAEVRGRIVDAGFFRDFCEGAVAAIVK